MSRTFTFTNPVEAARFMRSYKPWHTGKVAYGHQRFIESWPLKTKGSGTKRFLDKRGALDILGDFWSRVEVTDKCWLWRGNPGTAGGGQYSIGDRNRPATLTARRFAWELNCKEELRPDFSLRVVCGTGNCVRPDHTVAVQAGKIPWVKTIRGYCQQCGEQINEERKDKKEWRKGKRTLKTAKRWLAKRRAASPSRKRASQPARISPRS